jgi:UDP-N-acetylmuramoylalanine--D-glutamate ligase
MTMLTPSSVKSARLVKRSWGNIESFAWQVVEDKFDSYILELRFPARWDHRLPHIAITNISPDHLDRYDYKYENY